jgi:hypothetical protein
MLHRIGVLPVRFSHFDGELSVTVTRIVGYRMVCSCGESGARRSTYALARIDAQAHRSVSEDGEGIAPLEA